MTQRALVLAVVAAVLAVAGLVVWPKYVARSSAEPPLGARAPGPAPVLRPSVAERLARIDARLRLPPDGRALRALGEIRALVKGGPATPAEATWTGSGWKITQGGETVGMLSPYPSFESLLSLMDAWADHLHALRDLSLAKGSALDPELARHLARFDDAEAFAALWEVDARWARHRASVGDLLAATEAFGQLALLLPDDSPAADALHARALACLTLARLAAPERARGPENAIARALGYGAHARELGRDLPGDAPLSAFFARDLPGLERMAAKKDAGQETRFLYGRILALESEVEPWIDWFNALPKPVRWQTAMARTALEMNAVQSGRFVPQVYAAILLTRFGVSLADAPRDDADAPLVRCPELGRAVARAASGRAGPLADTAFTADAYRGACAAAVRARIVFFTEAFGAPKSALALARRLPDDREREPALAALRRWTELVADPSAGAPAALQQMLLDPTPLRAEDALDLARRWRAQLPPGDPRQSEVGDVLAARLDARPVGLTAALEVAQEFYRDPALNETLLRASVDAYGDDRPWLGTSLAAMRGDWKSLWATVEQPDQPEMNLLRAFEWLADAKGADRARLRAAFEAAIRRHPDSRALREHFAGFLADKVGDREAAREELRATLGFVPEGIQSDTVVSRIARLYRLDHRYADSWKLLAPRVDGMVGVIMSEAVRAQIGLGDLEKAEQIARGYSARYEGSLGPASDLAMVLWAQRRWAEAAQLVAQHPPRVDAANRLEAFSHAFKRAFAERPSADAEAAFKALVAAQLDYALLQACIEELRNAGLAETAFALGVLMNFPDGQIQIDTEAYKSLRAARGDAAARDWLRDKMPRSSLPAAAKVFYFRDADELLWTLLDDPESQGGEALWALRAAAYLREKHPDPSHRDALAEHYRASRASYSERVGAAVMGQLDGDALLVEATNERDLATAAYFLGAAAEAAHDMHRAMRLYQLALTCQTTREDAPRLDADKAVERIQASGFGLDALAAGLDVAGTDLAVPAAAY